MLRKFSFDLYSASSEICEMINRGAEKRMKHKWLVTIFLSMLGGAAFADDVEQRVPIENITKWTGDSYKGSIQLTFSHEYGVISAKIETDALILVSLTPDQLENYVGLFTDPTAVEKYEDGQPWTQDKVEKAVQEWSARWQVNQDPFSAFAIFAKKRGNAFVGHIVLGHGSRYGQSELALLLKPAFCNIGYATQAVTAVLYGYLPHLVKEKYAVNLNNTTVDPSPLRSVHATGRFDDTFSGQAMIRSGMQIGEEDVLWGAQRFHYLIRVDEILNSDLLPQVPSYLQPDDSLYDSAD